MHTIQSVSERTGLTPDVIRIWERRYQAVSPHRTAANQRQYSDDDIERLELLKRITDAGRRISAVANLDNEALRSLLPQQPAAINTSQPQISDAINAIQLLDPIQFSAVLDRVIVNLGSVAFMMEFASPLMETIGKMWRAGTVRTCQEHFASAHLRSFLGRYMLDANTDPNGPRLIVATLPGQAHELGAAMAAVVAAQGGWNVVYLGPNVPLEEIAFSADCKDARAVAISTSYPLEDPRVPALLRTLRQKLPSNCQLLVGGASASRHRNLISELGAWEAESLTRLAAHLDRLR